MIVADCTVAPTFSNIFFNVSPGAGINGNISPSTTEAVTSGATRQFAITPDSGYAVVTPIGGSCPQGTLNGTIYTTGLIIADCTVAPLFSNIIYHVTPSAGINGSINPSAAQIVASGSARQFTITPDSGYAIVIPIGGSCPQGTLAGTAYTTGPVTGDCTLVASFSLLPTYRISGTVATAANVGIRGVSLSLTGSGTTLTSTDDSGLYSFAGAANGSYTLAPSLSGYSFAPISKTITVSGADLPGQNFTGTPPEATYSISGTVTSGGAAFAGVTVTLSGQGSTSATSDSSGNYSFIGALNGAYTLTPVKAGYDFNPATLAASITGSNLTAMNFAATANSAPAAPSGLTATAVSSSRLTLSWNDNANNETGYLIERKTGPDAGYAQIGTAAANTATYNDTSLSASTTYYYRVRATNVIGDSGYTAEVNAATPVAPTYPELLKITGGTYTMGDGTSSNNPAHQVTVSDFYIGGYEVTQGEWSAVMGDNPSFFTACGPGCPVENVSWNRVQDFISTLNQRSGKSYRLPTEAEWEYAARSGGQLQKYSGGSDVGAVAWYSGNSGGTTHQIGTKQGNALGIFDMSGNVWEWVSDWFDSAYYDSSPEMNPAGPASGPSRVIRGGSWSNVITDGERTTYRTSGAPTLSKNFFGFRLAASVP